MRELPKRSDEIQEAKVLKKKILVNNRTWELLIIMFSAD